MDPISPTLPSLPPLQADEWDALILGDANEEREESRGTGETIVSPTPLYQTPSPYRPIATSVDPGPHRDDAPLFSFSEKPEKDSSEVTEGVEVSSQMPSPSSPPLLYADEWDALIFGGVTPAMSATSGDTRNRMLSGFALAPIVATKLSPAPRATAQVPKVAEEHHLTIPERHALTKIVQKTVFAFLLASSALLILSEVFPGATKILFAGSRTLYIAGVGMASP